MALRFPLAVFACTIFLTLAGCDETPPSDLAFKQVSAEIAKGDTSFRAYLEGLSNRKIKWTGMVVETRKWHEEDYVPAAGMLIDMDGQPGPDLMVKISEDDFDRMKAGAKATFIAYISGTVDEKGKALLKLEADKVE